MLLAHGIGGGGSDLPVPAWLVAYGVAATVLVASVAAGPLWPRPLLAAAALGRALPPVVQRVARPATLVLRAVGLAVHLGVLVACLAGVDEGASNPGPWIAYAVFWVGVQLASALLGDVWRALNPLDTLTLVLTRGRLPERTGRPDPGLWPAAAMVAGFAWLQLAFHESDSPRAVGLWLAGHTVASLAGALAWGRLWLLEGEGFAALFGLLGAIGPVGREPQSGRLVLRRPLAGLAEVRPQRGLVALVVVAVGSALFDAVTALDAWSGDVVGSATGWAATAWGTLGLAGAVAAVAAIWALAARASAAATGADPVEVAEALVPALAPIVAAHALGHHLPSLVHGAVTAVALASDPLGRGWDLFGTIDLAPDRPLLSARLVAGVQVAAMAAGHLAALAVAHDRTVERVRRPRLARRALWPVAGALVASAAGGLLLLLSA